MSHGLWLEHAACWQLSEVSSTTSVTQLPAIPHPFLFFFKEIGFISAGWLQRVHNLSSVTTVPVTSYIEVYTE